MSLAVFFSEKFMESKKNYCVPREKFFSKTHVLLILRISNLQLDLLKGTEWKFHDFSITQFLREINFGDSRYAKFAILTHLEALNYDF